MIMEWNEVGWGKFHPHSILSSRQEEGKLVIGRVRGILLGMELGFKVRGGQSSLFKYFQKKEHRYYRLTMMHCLYLKVEAWYLLLLYFCWVIAA